MVEKISSTLHPHDPQYIAKRTKQVNTLLRELTTKQINDYLINAAHTPPTKDEREEQRELTKRVLGEMLAIEGMERALHTKSILDSTGGGTSGGSVLIRQDLEAPLLA